MNVEFEGNIGEATYTLTGSGDDTIIVEGGNNSTIDTGDGNDLISIIGGSQNVFYSGAGEDSIIVESGSDTIDAGEGNDVATIQVGSHVFYGSSGDDTIIVNGGQNSIDVGAGSNYVTISARNNTIKAGEGSNFLSINNTIVNNIKIAGFNEDDTIKFNKVTLKGIDINANGLKISGKAQGNKNIDVILFLDDIPTRDLLNVHIGDKTSESDMDSIIADFFPDKYIEITDGTIYPQNGGEANDEISKLSAGAFFYYNGDNYDETAYVKLEKISDVEATTEYKFTQIGEVDFSTINLSDFGKLEGNQNLKFNFDEHFADKTIITHTDAVIIVGHDEDTEDFTIGAEAVEGDSELTSSISGASSITLKGGAIIFDGHKYQIDSVDPDDNEGLVLCGGKLSGFVGDEITVDDIVYSYIKDASGNVAYFRTVFDSDLKIWTGAFSDDMISVDDLIAAENWLTAVQLSDDDENIVKINTLVDSFYLDSNYQVVAKFLSNTISLIDENYIIEFSTDNVTYVINGEKIKRKDAEGKTTGLWNTDVGLIDNSITIDTLTNAENWQNATVGSSSLAITPTDKSIAYVDDEDKIYAILSGNDEGYELLAGDDGLAIDEVIATNLDKALTINFATTLKVTGTVTINGQTYISDSDLTINVGENATTLTTGKITLSGDSKVEPAVAEKIQTTSDEIVEVLNGEIIIVVTDGKLTAVENFDVEDQIKIDEIVYTNDGDKFKSGEKFYEGSETNLILAISDIENWKLPETPPNDDTLPGENTPPASNTIPAKENTPTKNNKPVTNKVPKQETLPTKDTIPAEVTISSGDTIPTKDTLSVKETVSTADTLNTRETVPSETPVTLMPPNDVEIHSGKPDDPVDSPGDTGKAEGSDVTLSSGEVTIPTGQSISTSEETLPATSQPSKADSPIDEVQPIKHNPQTGTTSPSADTSSTKETVPATDITPTVEIIPPTEDTLSAVDTLSPTDTVTADDTLPTAETLPSTLSTDTVPSNETLPSEDTISTVDTLPGEDTLPASETLPSEEDSLPAEDTVITETTLTADDTTPAEETEPVALSMSTETIDNELSIKILSNSDENFTIAESGATLYNYDIKSGTQIQLTNVNNIVKAIENNAVTLKNNEIICDSDVSILFINSVGNSPDVQLSIINSQLVGWTNDNGGILDLSNESENLVLVGDYTNDKIGTSTLKGGTGDDTVFAGAGDYINLSGGCDLIELSRNDTDAPLTGATVDFSNGSGRSETTIKGFSSGFEDKADRLQIDNREEISFDFLNGNLHLKFNNTSLLLNPENNNPKYIFGTNNDSDYEEILINDDTGKSIRYSFLNENATLNIANSYEQAKEYYGLAPKVSGNPNDNGTTMDYSDFEETLFVNFGDTLTSGITHYHNIDKLIGGRGESFLVGDANVETLEAGAGKSTIWSTAGRDVMSGYTGQDKVNSTEFFYLEGDGLDTIINFKFGSDEAADKINFFGQDVTDIKIIENDVYFYLGENSNDHVIIRNAKNEIVQINNTFGRDWTVEIGDELHYNNEVNAYISNADGVLSITSDYGSIEDEVAIYSQGGDGKVYTNIKKLDASDFSGNTTLVGNENNNVIMASKGASTLWGGAGKYNDTLDGGSSGHNEYFYLKGDGRDLIKGATSNDEINLLNIDFSDIISTEIEDDSIIIKFNDGGSLQLQSSADVTFKFSNGSRYVANRSDKSWTKV